MAHRGSPSGEQRQLLMKDVLRIYDVESTPSGTSPIPCNSFQPRLPRVQNAEASLAVLFPDEHPEWGTEGMWVPSDAEGKSTMSVIARDGRCPHVQEPFWALIW